MARTFGKNCIDELDDQMNFLMGSSGLDSDHEEVNHEREAIHKKFLGAKKKLKELYASIQKDAQITKDSGMWADTQLGQDALKADKVFFF